MGFFYKAGTVEGEPVVEGASYNALASSAKSQAHGVLMKDTSTGFYYKNYRTGGPGIPVPVEYFDSVTGYLSNASGNAFVAPADSYSDLLSRGWSNNDLNDGTSTKTSGADLVLDVPTSAAWGSRAGTWFIGTGASHQQYLSIMTISSYTPGPTGGAGHNYGTGLAILWAANNTAGTGSTRLHYNLSFGATTAGRYTLSITNAGGTTVGDGPNASFTSGTVITVADFSDNSLTTNRGTSSAILEQSVPNVAASYGPLVSDLCYLSITKLMTAPDQLTLNISEVHILKI